MPLPGGPANKFGNRYEQWWTVSQLVRILDGKAKSIRIEDPAVDKAEFVLTADGYQEFHQAKRNHRDGGKWSLSSLKHEGLLQALFDQLSSNPDARFIFVSGSDAPELRELTERARSAQNLEEFESAFIKDEKNKGHFKRLGGLWHADATKAYEILQRVQVRAIDERGLEEQVQESLLARFLTDPDKVCDALRSIVEDSIHKTINHDALISALQHKGFGLRQLAKPNDAPTLVASATDHYLKIARRRLIQSTLIPRSSTQDLLAKINDNATNGADCVLTGQAGGGKTGCAIECVEALRQGDNPAAVLAFRLDRIESVSSTKKLGACLGLEESPVLVLATAAEAMSSEAILLIDQLDAVSTTSGRSSDFLDVVEDLLSEVRGLRNRVKFHVVIVCRAFDWENDHRLRRLVTKGIAQISVTNFSLDEAKNALTTSGFKTELFDAKQLELLRLPQNLALFLATHHDPDLRPTFFLAKDLFDQYWKEKRKAVNARVASSDRWQGVIQTLCDEMTSSQQLSVLKEKLDQFPNDYLDQMVSEGVLSFDRNRYGFGHESFFDYCFARGFVAKEESLAEFLLTSEQHLFRRAQVRQVLVYLRDASHERYCEELHTLLKHQNIRYHLKDLAVALAVSLPDPEENEWGVLARWIESELEAIKIGRPNPDKFASAVWNHFRASQPWFRIADKKGLITDWLTSNNNNLVDVGVDYVRIHQRHSGDRMAELLEPLAGRDGDWSQRLSYIMQWPDLEHSRRFFELFLRLIDDGTLDNTRGSFASNDTFWSMLYSLSKARPAWVAEVLAHWLLRRLSIIRQTRSDADQPDWHEFFKREHGSKEILEAAIRAPEALAQHVLPVVLRIADEAAETEESAPKRDAVLWTIFLSNSEYPSFSEACRSAITAALEKLAETKADSIDGILAELRNRDTCMANFLLLRAYTAGAKHFADDAVTELCNNTWRFDCGYSDSPYWVAKQLIGAIAPLCSDENRARLERAILNYTPDDECTRYGYQSRGRAGFALLSGIPAGFHSRNAQRRYAELERKFGAPAPPPRSIQGYWVDSPIAKADAEKMTDAQWLKAMQKYDSKERQHRWENPEKGSALELARTLQELVKQEPERFARLSLRFPSGTHPYYVGHTLSGLKETDGYAELKLKVCRKAYDGYRETCGKELADMLGSIEETLPDDAVQMLAWLATEHPDPERELWNEQATGGTPYYGGDILEHGINTTRGRAADAIRGLIQRDRSYIQRFRSTIERLVADDSAAVRACAGFTLLAIVNHDPEFALGQFLRLVEPRGDQISDEHLLTTRYVEHFINYGLCQRFDCLQPIVEWMLRSNLPKTSEAGSRLASIAALLGHGDAEALVEEALRGHPSQRLGVARVASANIGKAEYRQWSEQKLLLFLNDENGRVRQEAATCFRYMESQPLEAYESLISRFCDSAAYQDDSSSLLRALEKSPHKLPGITLTACEKFLERFGEEARDIRTHRAADGSVLAKLILRTYHQHQRDEWTAECLDLIDRMCLERSYDVHAGLDEYER
jgi:hypothetical protein